MRQTIMIALGGIIRRLQRSRAEVVGPLISWTLIFTIGAMIRIFAFKSSTVLYEIAPAVSLWAIGILFTLATSRQAFFHAKWRWHYDRQQPDQMLIRPEVILPEENDFSPRCVYFFLIGLSLWLFVLFLSYNAVEIASASKATPLTLGPIALADFRFGAIVNTLLSWLIVGGLVVTALDTLDELT